MQPDLSSLLGEESEPIDFPAGLLGFEEYRHFVLVTHPEGGPLTLLQCIDDERISFVIAHPEQIDTSYKIELSEADKKALQMEKETEIDAYCILSVQREPFKVTANMLGPLVINWKTGLGRQVILSDSGYSVRHPLIAPEAESRGK